MPEEGASAVALFFGEQQPGHHGQGGAEGARVQERFHHRGRVRVGGGGVRMGGVPGGDVPAAKLEQEGQHQHHDGEMQQQRMHSSHYLQGRGQDDPPFKQKKKQDKDIQPQQQVGQHVSQQSHLISGANFSNHQILDDLSCHVGEPVPSSEVLEGQFFVVESEEVEYGCMEVVDMDGVFDDVVSELVG